MKRLFLVLAFVFAYTSVFAQTESRIIRMDKVDQDEATYLEITNFKVGDSEIYFNESFSADENWLKNIKVKVKNISGKNITCLGLHFGLLKGINEKLEARMSWADVIGFYKGNCYSKQDKNKSVIKNGEVIELTYADISKQYEEYYKKLKMGEFYQARFAYGATVIFEGEKEEADTSYFSAPNNVRYFEEDN